MLVLKLKLEISSIFSSSFLTFSLPKTLSKSYFEIEMTEKEKQKRIEAMKYAIHSNELEGHKYTDKEKDFLMSVACDELTVEEAVKIILKK